MGRTAAAAWLAAGILVLQFSAAIAQERPPRVGVVLGGGGARGVAHIGVLKVLEEMRIPIACIAGTSMGALVGGLYAAGVTTDEMTERLARIDWDDLFNDDPARTEKPFRAKRDDFENLIRLELGIRGASFLLPSGATAGYKFEFLLRELTARAGNYAEQDFDRLPIPYRALATDIVNGTSKVFRSGDLVKAMRASMSVPGAISPVEIDGALYVDGGLLQNVPVAAAREACADVVIAVNVGAGLLRREELASILGVSLQMVNVLMEQNVRSSLASLAAADVLIAPELGAFSSTDFAGAMDLVPIGEAAARAQAEKLRKLSVSEEQYRAWRSSVAARLPGVPPVTEVRVVTRGERVNPEVIERELAEAPGIDLRRRKEQDFSVTNLNARLEQVYGRGDFERMDYRFVDRPGTRTVEVQGVEKSWGPHYLKFGLGLASDKEQTRFNVAASQRSTWLNALGGEWRNDAQIGYHDRLASEFYQPLHFRSGAFVAPRVEWNETPITFFLDGRRVGEYRVQTTRAHLDFGVQNKYGELRAGAFAGRLNAREDFGTFTQAPNFDIDQTGYTLSAIFDQIDRPQFPRDGLYAALRTYGTWETGDPAGNYSKAEFFALAAKTWGRHTLQLAGYWGETLSGGTRAYDPFLLGGFLRGSGYRMDELLGESAALLRAVYSHRLATLPHPVGSGVYLGGSLEGTRATLGGVDGPEKTRPSASLFLGADTFLGTVYLAFGQALSDDRPRSLYLMLGTVQ
jgi:NTE family protein